MVRSEAQDQASVMEVSAWVGQDAAPLAEAQDSVGSVEDCLEGKGTPGNLSKQGHPARSELLSAPNVLAAGNWRNRRRQTCSQRPSTSRIYRSVASLLQPTVNEPL
jgi:hypothetical protein